MGANRAEVGKLVLALALLLLPVTAQAECFCVFTPEYVYTTRDCLECGFDYLWEEIPIDQWPAFDGSAPSVYHYQPEMIVRAPRADLRRRE